MTLRYTNVEFTASRTRGMVNASDITDEDQEEAVTLFEECLTRDNRVDITVVDTTDNMLKLGETNMLLYVLARGGLYGFFEEGHRLTGKSAQGISVNYGMDSGNVGMERKVEREELNPSNYYAMAQRLADSYVKTRKIGACGYHLNRPQKADMFDPSNTVARRLINRY